MTRKNFLKGMKLVQIAMNRTIQSSEFETIYERVSSISDDDFLSGCEKICDEVPQFFPGTNMIALIKESARRGNSATKAEWDYYKKRKAEMESANG